MATSGARLVAAAVVAAVATMTLSGCAQRDTAPAQAQAPTAGIEATDTFPTASLADWVSYPSQLAVVEVVKESELPREGVLADTGYGYLGRSVTVNVEEVLWREPRERDVPSTFEMVVWGWIIGEDGVRREAQPEDAVRITPGQRYVVPVTYAGGRISPLSDHSVALLDAEDHIRLAPRQHDVVLEQYAGRPVTSLAQALSVAKPDPRAERRRDVEPGQRARLVTQERYEAGRK